MPKYNEDDKLKAIGLLSTGEYSAKEIARTLKLPYTQVLKWRDEAKDLTVQKDLEELIDVDSTVIHQIAEHVKEEFELIQDGSGELVDGVVKKLDKLQVLSENMQATGINLLNQINAQANNTTNAKDLNLLVDSLAKLQVAFFSKGASVNVLQMNQPSGNSSNEQISMFKSLMRSS